MLENSQFESRPNTRPIAQRIQTYIDALDRREVELDQFLQRLKQDIRFLSEARPEAESWNHELLELWVEIEIVYALASSRGQMELSASEIERVEQACTKIRQMVLPLT